jgi:hypothetical protein
MPTFDFTSPDGKNYSVQGPDGATPEQAIQVLQQHLIRLNIDGQRVNVSSNFLNLSPEDQQKTVDHIAGSLQQAAPDKYQQAARADIAAAKAAGADEGAGFTRRLAHGATLGADSTVLAALQTPLEMIKHRTLSPVEGYDYAKAREDAIMGDARNNTGALGNAVEMLGGAATGGNITGGAGTLARDAAGVASVGGRAGNIVTRAAPAITTGRFVGSRGLANTADAAIQGAVQGFNEGNGVGDRVENAVKGGLAGGAIGGAISGGGAIIGGTVGKLASAVRGYLAPESAARAQVARAIAEGGQTTAQIENAVKQAANEGQDVYTVADAMGSPGQRMLSTVARANGPGRTAVVDALESRQAGQGRRVANALDQGFDTPQTAAQTRAAMTEARDAAADTAYGAVRNGAGQVDVVPTLNHLDENISTGGGQNLQTPNDSVESVLRGFRERLARVNPDDFAAVQRIRGDMSDAAQSARQSGYGNKARMIGNAMRVLDSSLEDASQGYRQANANFAQRSRNIDAIDTGRTAALRGRTEDTIPAYNALPAEGQAGFRAGYVDPLIEAAQGSAQGVNKARPLTSDAFRDEATAIAPGNNLMQRRIGRENTMFQTRNAALGGSKTADNLADQEAMAIDPTLAAGVIANALHGNWVGALRQLGNHGASFFGNTAAVRAAVSRYLLQNGRTMAPGQLQAAIDQTVTRIQRNARIANLLSSAATKALVTAQNESRNLK